MSNKWIERYYYIAVLMYFLYLFIPQLRVGVLCGILMLIVLGSNFGNIINDHIVELFPDFIVLCYMVWCLISVLIGTVNGFSISIGISEYANSILPIIFFFFAKKNWGRSTKFKTAFIDSAFFISVVGLLFYD